MTFDGIGISFGFEFGFGNDPLPPSKPTIPKQAPKSGTSSYSSSPEKYDPDTMPPLFRFGPTPEVPRPPAPPAPPAQAGCPASPQPPAIPPKQA